VKLMIIIYATLLCGTCFGQWIERKIIPLDGNIHPLLVNPDAPKNCIVTGDVNGDGIPDLAVTVGGSIALSSSGVLQISGKDGTFIRFITDPPRGFEPLRDALACSP
jgi:hypothetical protein